jgi:hypothetical protein
MLVVMDLELRLGYERLKGVVGVGQVRQGVKSLINQAYHLIEKLERISYCILFSFSCKSF